MDDRADGVEIIAHGRAGDFGYGIWHYCLGWGATAGRAAMNGRPGGPFLPFLPCCDEHAVGVELLGPEQESGGLRVESGERIRGEFRMRGGEGFGDRGRLRAGERADRIDEPAAGLERARDIVEQQPLHDGEFPDVLWLRGPPGVRIALPGADTGARRIDQDAVELGLGRELDATLPRRGAQIEDLSAGRALLELGEPAVRTVGRPDQSFVPHQVGEMHGLAALAGARVPPRLASLRGGAETHGLRSDVLDFAFTPLEFLRAIKVGQTGVAQRISRLWSRGEMA